MHTTVRRSVKFKSGKYLEEGENISVFAYTNKDGSKSTMYAEVITLDREEKQVIVVDMRKLHRISEDFTLITEDMIAEAMTDGRCESMTGETVEPDGWDSKGFPSVLMACGLM